MTACSGSWLASMGNCRPTATTSWATARTAASCSASPTRSACPSAWSSPETCRPTSSARISITRISSSCCPDRQRAAFEGFGLAYVEAGLSGTAAVGSAHGGAVEAVQHDVTGWIVDPDQEESAARELLALARDADRRRRYADAARAWALRELDPTRFVRGLLGRVGAAP